MTKLEQLPILSETKAAVDLQNLRAEVESSEPVLVMRRITELAQAWKSSNPVEFQNQHREDLKKVLTDFQIQNIINALTIEARAENLDPFIFSRQLGIDLNALVAARGAGAKFLKDWQILPKLTQAEKADLVYFSDANYRTTAKKREYFDDLFVRARATLDPKQNFDLAMLRVIPSTSE